MKVKHRLTYELPNEGSFSQILDSLPEAEEAEARIIAKGARDTHIEKLKYEIKYFIPNEGVFSKVLDSLQEAEEEETRLIAQGAKDTEIEMYLPECGQPCDDSIPA